MKICLLTHTFPRFPKDVAAPFMDGVARSLVNAGNEVFVLTPFNQKFAWKKSSLPYKLITYKYIFPDSLHKLGYSETLNNDMSLKFVMLALSPFLYFFGLISLIKLTKKEKIQIVSAHWILPNGFIASIAKLLTGVPVVSTLPGSDVYMVKMNKLFNLLGTVATRVSNFVTSNSPQLIVDLETSTKTNLKSKSAPIIYGVDPKKFKPNSSWDNKLRKELRIPKNSKIILGVGRLVAKKGFEYLIKAAPEVLKKNKNTFFVVIGDGDQREYLKNLSKKYKVDKNFRFTGWVNYDDLVYYYNLSSIFILPSVRDEEGNLDDQSVSVVEAMSCGKAVITSDFPGYQLVIENEVNGYLVKEKDSKAIALALNKVLSSKGLLLKMQRNNRNTAIENLSWDAIGKQYSALFESIVNKKNSYYFNVPQMSDESNRKMISKQIVSVLKKELGELKNKTCLDLASSNGIISNELSKHFKRMIGVDVDSEAIKLAKSKFRRSNLKFLEMNGERMIFKNNSFDVVVCNQVYNFVENPQKLVNEIYRVLKPGGVCYFGARNKWGLIEPQYKLPFLSLFPRLLPYGKNYMSLWELKRLLKKFRANNLTVKILRNSEEYGFSKLAKYSKVAKFLPLETFEVFIPNYIFLLSK